MRKNKNKFKVGDTVCVKDSGKLYTTYLDFFIDNDIDIETCLRYAYNDPNFENNTFTITYIIGDKVIIEEKDKRYPNTYLIHVDGIAHQREKLTLKELYDIVGFEFDIIDDDGVNYSPFDF